MRHQPGGSGDLERLYEMTRRRPPRVGEGASEVVAWRRRAEVDGDERGRRLGVGGGSGFLGFGIGHG
jgi:hypothetical protein